jgi:nucleotide-binding universal stress UspA family protein
MIQHILIPMDFSATAEAAAEYGFALAGELGARVTLLHVLSPGVVTLPEASYAPTEEERAARDGAARAQLRALAFRRVRAGVHVGCDVVEGAAVEGIGEYAREHAVDVIVMGTHGRRGLSHLLLGSVAEALLRAAPCPVLTVGPDGARANGSASL